MVFNVALISNWKSEYELNERSVPRSWERFLVVATQKFILYWTLWKL